jgi:hypothetical protein
LILTTKFANKRIGGRFKAQAGGCRVQAELNETTPNDTTDCLNIGKSATRLELNPPRPVL